MVQSGRKNSHKDLRLPPCLLSRSERSKKLFLVLVAPTRDDSPLSPPGAPLGVSPLASDRRGTTGSALAGKAMTEGQQGWRLEGQCQA